jgi:hypothetical protein
VNERQRRLYSATLKKRAGELQALFPNVPIDLGRVCAQLNTEVKYVEGNDKLRLKPEITADPNRRGGFIILSRPAIARTGFERFCIAHELAHGIIWKEFEFKPEATSEYWEFEQVCDEFARELLLPKEFIEQLLNNSDGGLKDILWISLRAKSLGRVHWGAAAHRLSDIISHVRFFRIKDQVITFTTMPKSKEIRRKLPVSTEFSSLILMLESLKVPGFQRRLAHDIAGPVLRDAGVPSWVNALCGAAIPGRSEVMLAVRIRE